MSLASYVPIVGTAKAKRKIKYQNNSMMTYLNYQKIKPSRISARLFMVRFAAQIVYYLLSVCMI